MEVLAKRLVSFWIRCGIINEEEAEWCCYSVLRRLTTLCSLCGVLIVGCMVANVVDVMLFTFCLMTLRAYTNGYHSKSYIGCFFLSVLIEITSLACVRYLTLYISGFIVVISSCIILFFSPTNNEKIHLSTSEIACIRQKVYTRLAGMLTLYILLIFVAPSDAFYVAMALLADAGLLVLAVAN